MATPIQKLNDQTIRHTVLLERFKSGQIRKIEPFLREIDRGIREKLTRDNLTDFTRARLTALLAEVEALIDFALNRWHSEFSAQLRQLAASEAAFEVRSLGRALPDFDTVLPSEHQIFAAITATPLSVRGAQGGMLLAPFLERFTESQKQAVVGAIRRGVFEGQTTAQIIQVVRGTRARQYRDGILAVSSRQAEAVVRTGVRHVSSVARTEVFKANNVKQYRWLTTLDNRTSEVCQGLSGRVFEVGAGPVPPAHINCRSDIVAVPPKEFEFLEKGATQSSQFGYVDAKETYFSWLKQQPAAFQDKALGPVRGKLLRSGGLSAKRFSELRLDRNFQPLTLAQMQALEPLAFDKAGIRLNPKTGRVIQ